MRLVLRVLLGTLATLVLIVAVGLFALLYLPLSNEQRQTIAELWFEQLLEREIEIEGDVDIEVGRMTRIGLSEVTISETADSEHAGRLRVSVTVFEFPLIPALRGAFDPETVLMDGMKFEFSGHDRADTRASTRVALSFITWILDREQTPRLTLRNVAFLRVDDPEGWDGTLVIDDVVVRAGENPGAPVTLTAAGQVNAEEFRIEAEFPLVDPATPAVHPFDVSGHLPGADVTLTGHFNETEETIEATLDAVSPSVAKLVKAIRLAPGAGGTARFGAHLEGSYDELSATDIHLNVDFAGGDTLAVEGSVGDVHGGNQVDLKVLAKFVPGSGFGTRLSSALDLELRSIDGRLVGGSDGMQIKELELSTNIASAELRDIGPITIEQIVRGDDGELGLLGLRLVEQSDGNTVLDMSGEIRDVIDMSDMEFSGRFNIDLVTLITRQAQSKSDIRLAGTLKLSDETGSLDVDELEAATSGDVLSVTFAKPRVDIPLKITLHAPDIDAVAAAMGKPAIGGGSATFEGVLTVEDDVSLIGEAAVGKSDVSVSINADVRDGYPILSGSIDARMLRLVDMVRTAALGDILVRKPRTIDFEESFAEGLRAELDVTAARLAGLAEKASGLEAHLSYAEDQAVVQPLKLTVFDGEFDARLDLDNRGDIPALRLAGHAEHIDIPALFEQFDAKPILTGSLHARFDLNGRGDGMATILDGLGGSIEIGLVDAVLGNRLIDLTGQDIVSWLFSGGPGGEARLTCAVIGTTFVNGVGTFQPLLIATENVQLNGSGTLNLVTDELDVGFQPHPLHEHLVDIVTPFRIEGPLESPQVTGVSGADIAGRVVLETLALPLRPLDLLIGAGGNEDPAVQQHPCVDIAPVGD